MAAIKKLFPSQIYFQKLTSRGLSPLLKEILKESFQIKDYDEAGQRWSKLNYPGGYTSYGSLSELNLMSSTFKKVEKLLQPHALRYAKSLDMDLKNYKLNLTNIWINIVPKMTYHGLHIHPLSTLSGTLYVKIPKNSSQIKFEDPRMTCFMGSIPRKTKCSVDNQRFFSLKPKEGHIVLFESWIRHEVPQNLVDEDRVSVSFNYHWS